MPVNPASQEGSLEIVALGLKLCLTAMRKLKSWDCQPPCIELLWAFSGNCGFLSDCIGLCHHWLALSMMLLLGLSPSHQLLLLVATPTLPLSEPLLPVAPATATRAPHGTAAYCQLLTLGRALWHSDPARRPLIDIWWATV